MVQALLADRFKLKSHWETRDVPVQALVIAKSGPKLRRPSGESGTGAKINGHIYNIGLVSRGTTDGWTMSDLAALLAIDAEVRHEPPIVDRTGLEGMYQFDLEFSPPQFPSDRPELNTALQQQLGLKLEQRREPMQVMVIEILEKASEN